MREASRTEMRRLDESSPPQLIDCILAGLDSEGRLLVHKLRALHERDVKLDEELLEVGTRTEELAALMAEGTDFQEKMFAMWYDLLEDYVSDWREITIVIPTT
jgi:hypothetical protein